MISTPTINDGSIEGTTIKIGANNNVFKADSSGIYLGHNVFANAPFKVNMQGQMTVRDITINGISQSRALFNSNSMALQIYKNNAYSNSLYFDGEKNQFVFEGELTANTVLSDALITKILSSENAYIANLTVSELETSEFVQKYLANDTSDVLYTKILMQDIKMIVAKVKLQNGQPITKQLTNKHNTNLYWTDNLKKTMTTTITAYPVIIYDYELSEKMTFQFYGAGTPTEYYPPMIS